MLKVNGKKPLEMSSWYDCQKRLKMVWDERPHNVAKIKAVKPGYCENGRIQQKIKSMMMNLESRKWENSSKKHKGRKSLIEYVKRKRLAKVNADLLQIEREDVKYNSREF